MAVIKIDLERPVQQFELGGKVFEVGYDDESLKKYEKVYLKMKNAYEKYEKLGLSATEKQMQESENKMRDLVTELIELYFGKGSFEHVYEASGKSILNVQKVATFVIKTLNEKGAADLKDKANHYLKK
ncbi:hypothetical protein FKN04_22365 [Bacillus glycinifermentans]|uniref:phage tail assembly chaperone n=1 Tax=Bacillus glycinifermentans TaxID=1664069 RepID=UPI00158185BB|nr:phage tail assembly chaperone [Bacillus glycinifermentans]NUJ19280.1 hypothetical protein [Bacillus glycinifermentans]